VTTILKIAAMAALAVLLQSAPRDGNEKIGNLSWLAGPWALDAKGNHIEEYWTTPAGDTMLGLSRTTANGKTVEFEFLRIEQRPDGLVYIAQPEGRLPTEFRLAHSDGDEWVFANPKLDFPRRIRYRRMGPNSLIARIEDESGAKHVDFNYSRSK